MVLFPFILNTLLFLAVSINLSIL